MRFETLAIHAGERPDAMFGAISVPIYQTSTFVFEDVGKTRGYDYSRTANPTRKVLEDTIAQPFRWQRQILPFLLQAEQ